ncbi:hypothetical protein DH2020_034314 [Rehmannia glutinosa]|uniref:LOB domain-containing protein n=1 Tax=Rehmannia glutinosa TaxID=99300 RepID=A0ABR0VCJ8_REHGL
MDVPQGDGTSDQNRRRGPGKRSATGHVDTADAAPPTNAPCGACKFLRRKCISGCIFAPHFGRIKAPPGSRLCTRCSGQATCRSFCCIFRLTAARCGGHDIVASLQAELSVVQTQLLNSRFVMANALEKSSAVPPQHHHHMIAAAVLQPAYSNTSSASNNLISFTPNFGESCTALSNSNFEPIPHLSGRAVPDEDEEEEQSHDPVAFANHIFH